MQETEFKALTYSGQYVDANMLHKGIYQSEKPFIYPKDYTIETMAAVAEKVYKLTEAAFITDGYLLNLNRCDLTPIIVLDAKVFESDMEDCSTVKAELKWAESALMAIRKLLGDDPTALPTDPVEAQRIQATKEWQIATIIEDTLFK